MFQKFSELKKEDQQAFSSFNWTPSAKVAYDPETQHILIRGKGMQSIYNRDRYYIWPIEKTNCFASFLAKGDIEAMAIAPQQKQIKPKKPEPKLEEIVKPEYRIRVKRVWFKPGYYNTFFEEYVENKEYDVVDLEIDDTDISSEQKQIRIPAKQALATFRKAFKAYRHSPLYRNIWKVFDNSDTGGTEWTLHIQVIRYFADWFVFSAPLDELLQQAETQARAAKKKKDEEEAQGYDAFARDFKKRYGGFFGNSASTQGATREDALKVLGLKGNVTAETVKSTYRQLAKRHHPDVGGDAAQFRKINDAYQTLIKTTA